MEAAPGARGVPAQPVGTKVLMKPYREVVNERFDGRERQLNIYTNQYSLINPAGFYGNQRVREAFYKVFNKIRQLNIDVTAERILDIGCGAGGNTRLFAEMVGSTTLFMQKIANGIGYADRKDYASTAR